MRSLNLVFLSLGTFVAGFSFSNVPAATVNQASLATLNRDNSDPASFSLILRLTSQQGGTTIQTFQSESGTDIPFKFTPTETGNFIIEAITNLQPISDTQQPDKILASSNTFTVNGNEELQSQSTSSSSSSSSDNGSTSSQNSATVGNNGNGQSSSTTSTSSTQSAGNSGSSSTAGSSITSASASVISTSAPSSLASSGTGATPEGALGTTSGGSALPSTSNSGSSSSGSGSTAGDSAALSTRTNALPSSTGTLAPSAATSKSSKTGMIIGIVFGVLAFVAICLALLLAYIRYRRRKRTGEFERKLMFGFGVRSGSPPASNDTTNSSSETDGNGYRESYTESDMVERRERRAGDVTNLQSVYSQQSVPSMYSDSPSIFYTAIPRAFVPPAAASPGGPAPPPPIHTIGAALPSTASSSTVTLASVAPTATTSAPAPLPQLAPGWVFPRSADVRRSQLPPPKTDRQMDIYDRKVRLQGKLIGMQGWGSLHATENEKVEIEMLKEQIRRLELLEKSDWALGKSEEFPRELVM